MEDTVRIDRSKLRRWAATFVVLALALFVTTQLVHIHALGKSTNESHCSLCIAAHSAAAPTQASPTPVLLQTRTVQVASEPQPHSRLSVFSSFIRPPPVSL